MIAVWVLIILGGMLSSRILIVSTRGSDAVQQSLFASIVGFLAMSATFSAFIWGFMHLEWYWPICGFIVGSVVAAVLVTRQKLVAWIVFMPTLNSTLLVGSAFLWFYK